MDQLRKRKKKKKKCVYKHKSCCVTRSKRRLKWKSVRQNVYVKYKSERFVMSTVTKYGGLVTAGECRDSKWAKKHYTLWLSTERIKKVYRETNEVEGTGRKRRRRWGGRERIGKKVKNEKIISGWYKGEGEKMCARLVVTRRPSR